MAATRKPAVPRPSPLAVQSWLAVVRAYNLCDAVLAERLATLGLRLGEHEVLVNLLRAPGITQQQLAQRCFVAKSGVSMLVTRMAQDGLLLREADAVDARLRRLTLTTAGTELAGRAQRIQDAVVAAMVGDAPEQQLQTVLEAMQRASVALERLRADQPAAPR